MYSPFGHTDDDDDDEDDDDAVQQNYEPSRQVGGCVSDGAREGSQRSLHLDERERDEEETERSLGSDRDAIARWMEHI